MLCRAAGVGMPAASKHLLHSKIKIVGEIRERDKGVKYPSPHPPFPGTDPGGTVVFTVVFLWFQRRGPLERAAFAACGTVLCTTERWE